MAAKISKLENQYQEEFNHGAGHQKLSDIFNNVAVFINGWTRPSAEELKRLMMVHGGVYHHYLNPRTTTHIIASNLCDAKMKQLKGDEKIVKPEWITESIAAGSLLDYKPYLLAGNLDQGQQMLRQFFTSGDVTDTVAEPDTSGSTRAEAASAASNSKTAKAADDNFISEFYNRSRLHHISTLGAEFKRYVAELQDRSEEAAVGNCLLQMFIIIFERMLTSIGRSGCVRLGLVDIEQWKRDNGAGRADYQSDEPVIMHIDMDCFFVSVGLRSYPELRGQPVVVTHARTDAKPAARRQGSDREYEFNAYRERVTKKCKLPADRDPAAGGSAAAEAIPRLQNLDETCSMSEIASCSYEARALGIYNGMFMGAALKLCPHLKAIPYDFDGYKEVVLDPTPIQSMRQRLNWRFYLATGCLRSVQRGGQLHAEDRSRQLRRAVRRHHCSAALGRLDTRTVCRLPASSNRAADAVLRIDRHGTQLADGPPVDEEGQTGRRPLYEPAANE